MFDFIVSLITWVINFLKDIFGVTSEKHVKFTEDTKGGDESDIELQLPKPSSAPSALSELS